MVRIKSVMFLAFLIVMTSCQKNLTNVKIEEGRQNVVIPAFVSQSFESFGLKGLSYSFNQDSSYVLCKFKDSRNMPNYIRFEIFDVNSSKSILKGGDHLMDIVWKDTVVLTFIRSKGQVDDLSTSPLEDQYDLNILTGKKIDTGSERE